jgi:hypothetical protein
MFVEHGGCEIFGEDASDASHYYLSEECEYPVDICYVELTLECTGSKLFFILKMGHKRFFTILRFHFVSSSLKTHDFLAQCTQTHWDFQYLETRMAKDEFTGSFTIF